MWTTWTRGSARGCARPPWTRFASGILGFKVTFCPDESTGTGPWADPLQRMGVEVVHLPYVDDLDALLAQRPSEFDVAMLGGPTAWDGLMSLGRLAPGTRAILRLQPGAGSPFTEPAHADARADAVLVPGDAKDVLAAVPEALLPRVVWLAPADHSPSALSAWRDVSAAIPASAEAAVGHEVGPAVRRALEIAGCPSRPGWAVSSVEPPTSRRPRDEESRRLQVRERPIIIGRRWLPRDLPAGEESPGSAMSCMRSPHTPRGPTVTSTGHPDDPAQQRPRAMLEPEPVDAPALRRALRSLRDSLAAARLDAEGTKAELVTARAELAHVRSQEAAGREAAARAEAELASVQQQLRDAEQLTEDLEAAIAAVPPATSGIGLLACRLRLARRSVARAIVRFAPSPILALLWHNPLFDAEFYRQRYPDLRASRMPPERHYRRHGVGEGR